MIAYQTHHKQWLKSPLKEIFEPLFVFLGIAQRLPLLTDIFTSYHGMLLKLHSYLQTNSIESLFRL